MSVYLVSEKAIEELREFIHVNTVTGLGVPLLQHLNTIKFKGKMSADQEKDILEIFNAKKGSEKVDSE